MFGKKPINKLELEELYRRHFDNLFTAAQRITQDTALSEDIVQDFFLHLLDVGLPKGHILNPGAYFRTSISRKAIEHIIWPPTPDSRGHESKNQSFRCSTKTK